MFDGEVDAQDEFESSVTTSIQKALSALWCSYKFPFRYKTHTFKTKNGTAKYNTPNGNIIQRTVNRKKVHSVRLGKTYLPLEPDYETLDDKTGQPTCFYIKNDEIFLYPTPDAVYKIEIEYLSIFAACDQDGVPKANLQDETDYIDVPEKYEDLFVNALIELAMMYAIASENDENYSGYKEQYDRAYKLLIEYSKGIDIDKTIGWK